MTNRIDFAVTVPADEWARLQRHVRYLEAALVQVLRGRRGIREWYSASELAALRLHGLPPSRQGIMRKARSDGWPQRFRGATDGDRIEYHFSGLPRRAFEHMISRVLEALPADESLPNLPEPPTVSAPAKAASNASPPWMLPLMRVIRGNRKTTVDDAMRALSKALPASVERPSRHEVAHAMKMMGCTS